MNTTSLERIVYSTVVLCLILAVWQGQCNKGKKTDLVFMDSSATKQLTEKNLLADRLTDIYRTKELKWQDSLEKLNKGLKTAKNEFTKRYEAILNKPRLNFYTPEIDSNCMLTLESAYETINQYDAVYTLQTKRLDSCFVQNSNLYAQVKINKQFAELALKDKGELIKENLSFKHIIWRLYRKKRK